MVILSMSTNASILIKKINKKFTCWKKIIKIYNVQFSYAAFWAAWLQVQYGHLAHDDHFETQPQTSRLVQSCLVSRGPSGSILHRTSSNPWDLCLRTVPYHITNLAASYDEMCHWIFNSSSPSAAYMPQWTGSAMVQVMACCLISAKPLPESMHTYCQLDP